MAYGTIKVDNITFTNGGVDESITVSGLYSSTTADITVTGTVSGNVVIGGTTVSGATVSGGVGVFVSGVFASGTAAAPSVSIGSTSNGFYSQGTDQLAIATSGVGRIFISSAGSLGIGGPATTTNLFVSGTVASDTITTTGNLQISRSSLVKTLISDTGSYFTSDLSAGSFIPTASGVPTNGMYLPSANNVAISTNGAGRLFVDSSGNVGVGTTAAVSLLSLNKGNVSNRGQWSDCALAVYNPTNLGAYSQIGFGYTLSQTYASAYLGFISTSQASSGKGDIVIGTRDVTTDSQPSEKLRITSDGKLGLGTSVPQAQLQVLDTIKISNSTQAQGNLILGDGGSTAFNVGIARWNGGTNAAGAGGIGYFAQGSSNIGGHFFYTGDAAAGSQTERMRISATGEVGIGTSSPESRLQIHYTSTAPSLSSSSGTGLRLRGNSSVSTTFGTYPGSPYASWIQSTDISGSSFPLVLNPLGGNVGIGTTSPDTVLSVQGAAGSTQLTLTDATNATVRLGTPAASVGLLSVGSGQSLAFGTQSTPGSTYAESARIDSSGRLGIGTAPDSPLHVVGTGGTSLRIGYTNNTNYFDANTQVFRSNNATTTYGQWDSSGRFLVGTSTARDRLFNSGGTESAQIQFEGTSQNIAFSAARNSADAGQPYIVLGKSRGTSVNSYTVVSNGDNLGTVSFQGADGTELINAAEITAQVDGTPGANDMPGRLVFSTTADGASSPTERVRIKSDGGVIIEQYCNIKGRTYIGSSGTDSSSIGAASIGVATTTLYIGNAAIQVSSDARLKDDIEDTQLDALDAISKVKVKDFIWNDPSDTSHNNRNARGKWTGLIAQELVEVLPFVVNAPRKEEDGSIDYESEERWTLDQSQLCPVLIKAVQQQQEIIASLEARLSALEAQ